MKNKVFGFSLIELMIVVAIIGILATVAVPSYRDAVLRGKRAEGRTALLSLMQQQERYMTQRNCYLGFSTTSLGAATASDPTPVTACGGVRAANVPFKVFSGENLTNSAYLLSAEPCPLGNANLSIAECVRVVATPKVENSDPEANVLRLTSSGFRDCTGSKPEVCWK